MHICKGNPVKLSTRFRTLCIASAKPILHPNATLNRVGEAQGRTEANACSPNGVYRNLVQRWLGEKGFEVMGWN